MVDQAWRQARRILLVRLDNLGDVLVTTPAFRAVRAALPKARLTLLASPVGAQVGRLNPDIDEVIVYEAPWMDPWQKLPHDPAREQAMIARLAREGFDGAIIFTSFRQSPLPAAYLCYLAGIPLRLAASIDGPGSLLTTRHKHPNRMMHEVERGLDLVRALGIEPDELDLVLDPGQAASDAAAALVARQRDYPNQPVVVIHPGCSMPARTYSWEQFAEAGDLLVRELGARVLLTGAPAEQPLTQRIQWKMRKPAVDLAGALPFTEFAGLIQAADLVVTNNTGPMHMAAALQTPVVALFALTNPPEQWGPWRVPHKLLYHDVPCRVCYSRICPFEHECLRLVTPRAIVEAAQELFRTTSTLQQPSLDVPERVVA
jgi:ADP-heptose:LPS heptosyltransferase